MEEQLRMVETLDTPVNLWHIDEHTREVGLEGVRRAREALRQAAVRTAA